jgi:hypothetical protein
MGETMSVMTNETFSRRMAQRRGDFGFEMGNRLAKAFERLSLIFSAINIRLTAQRELENREAQQREIGHEARKRKLLISLRRKIFERRTK